MEKNYYYFQAPNNSLYLNIDKDGWAYWSPEYCLFSKVSDEVAGEIYYKLEYHETYTGCYLYYNPNDYVGVFKDKNKKAAWTPNPLRVKNQNWKTYEYEKDGVKWLCIGNYEKIQGSIGRDLNEVLAK